MKKILLACLLSIVLVGCDNPPTNPGVFQASLKDNEQFVNFNSDRWYYNVTVYNKKENKCYVKRYGHYEDITADKPNIIIQLENCNYGKINVPWN